MLPSACNDTSAIKRNSQPQQLQRKGSSSSRRLSTQKARSTTLARRRSSSFAANAAERSDVLGEAVVSAEGGRRIRNTRRKQSVSRARRRSSTTNGNPSNSTEGPTTPALEMRRSKRRVKRFERGGGSGGGVVNNAIDQLAWAEREGGGAGWSLSEEERIGVVTDLVELFQQVDHNGDQVNVVIQTPCQTLSVCSQRSTHSNSGNAKQVTHSVHSGYEFFASRLRPRLSWPALCRI